MNWHIQVCKRLYVVNAETNPCPQYQQRLKQGADRCGQAASDDTQDRNIQAEYCSLGKALPFKSEQSHQHFPVRGIIYNFLHIYLILLHVSVSHCRPVCGDIFWGSEAMVWTLSWNRGLRFGVD